MSTASLVTPSLAPSDELEGRQRDLLTERDPIGECAVTLVLMLRKLIDKYIETHSLLTGNK